MFQFYNITEEQRYKINSWSDSVIDDNKQAMSSGKAYLLWSDRLYYQLEKDTWIDEEWWIKTAKELFVKHKDDCDDMGTAIIPALEILVHHFPEEYTEFARDKIDRWFNQSYHDPEDWWDLIVAACPDHPATKLIFEEHYSTWEAGIAIRLGDKTTIIETKENIISDLKEGGIGWIVDYLNILNKSILDDTFSRFESSMIRGKFLKIAQRELPIDSESWLYQHLALKPSIIMKWQEVIEALSKNVNYLKRILYLIETYDFAEDILQWSLTDKLELTENLISQLHHRLPSFTRPHHIDFPSLEFKLAIAWKRSQSKT